MKYQIKHVNGTVLFEAEIPDNTPSTLATRAAIEAAVRAKANLHSADLSFADLSFADLGYADLSSANLRSANLSSANLRSANLRGAYLRFANLRSANLRFANLHSANLRFADLSFADLSFADLGYADLSSANLGGANLSGAKLIAGTRLIGQRPVLQIGPIGSRSDFLLAFITDQGLRLQAGCFFGTRLEFEAKLDANHGDNEHAREYHAALVLIDAHTAIWTPDTGTLR